MESFTNFLAEHYIWFFVAAGVLFFALLGFIFDSKKKNKNDFKGESITEEPVEKKEEVEVGITPEVETLTPNPEPTQNVNLDNTIEINDIPLNNEVSTPVETISFGEPITLEQNTEVVSEPEIAEVPVNPELTPVDAAPAEPTLEEIPQFNNVPNQDNSTEIIEEIK